MNLREGIMEVAFEQWTERVVPESFPDRNMAFDKAALVDFNVVPTLQGSNIGE